MVVPVWNILYVRTGVYVITQAKRSPSTVYFASHLMD